MSTMLGILNLGHWGLPFGSSQGGEPFDLAQDHKPVERLVEPFGIWCLVLGFYLIFTEQIIFEKSEGVHILTCGESW